VRSIEQKAGHRHVRVLPLAAHGREQNELKQKTVFNQMIAVGRQIIIVMETSAMVATL